MSEHRMVGFLGNADINVTNAEALLDDFFPADNDLVTVLLPDAIPRTGGLHIVRDLLNGWAMQVQLYPVEKLVAKLADSKDDGYRPFLLVLYEESDPLVVACLEALAAGIPVLALNEGLDDIQLESTVTPKQYGQPRDLPEFVGIGDSGVVQAKVEGPATPAPSAEEVGLIGDKLTQIGLPTKVAEDLHQYGLLEAAIRSIVREEIEKVIGHRGHTEPLLNEPTTIKGTVPATIKAWTDGTDFKLPEGKRAPKGWKTVEITLDEAATKGLIE